MGQPDAVPSGRLDTNASDPSGKNTGLPSPSALRVSRTGTPPRSVSTRQILVRYSGEVHQTVCTASATQVPSGESATEPTRGARAYW